MWYIIIILYMSLCVLITLLLFYQTVLLNKFSRFVRRIHIHWRTEEFAEGAGLIAGLITGARYGIQRLQKRVNYNVKTCPASYAFSAVCL